MDTRAYIDDSAHEPGDIEPHGSATHGHEAVEASRPQQDCYKGPLGVDPVQYYTRCKLTNLHARQQCSRPWAVPAGQMLPMAFGSSSHL